MGFVSLQQEKSKNIIHFLFYVLIYIKSCNCTQRYAAKNKLVFLIIVKDCFFLQKMNRQKPAKIKNCTQRYAAKACRICDRFVCLQHKEWWDCKHTQRKKIRTLLLLVAELSRCLKKIPTLIIRSNDEHMFRCIVSLKYRYVILFVNVRKKMVGNVRKKKE